MNLQSLREELKLIYLNVVEAEFLQKFDIYKNWCKMREVYPLFIMISHKKLWILFCSGQKILYRYANRNSKPPYSTSKKISNHSNMFQYVSVKIEWNGWFGLKRHCEGVKEYQKDEDNMTCQLLSHENW